jgi:hypothetical protein
MPMVKILIVVLVGLLVLGGCAAPSYTSDQHCVERKDGKCVAWAFGPSKKQQAAFERVPVVDLMWPSSVPDEGARLTSGK